MTYIGGIMKMLILIAFGIVACWAATDITADDTLSAIVAPIGLMFFVSWGLGCLLVRVMRRGRGGRGDVGLSQDDFGDFGGGD